MGGGDNKSSSVAEPPEETKKYLTPYLQTASKLANNPYQAYQGQTSAGLNQDQNTAFGAIRNRALQGSEVGREANWNAADTLAGRYLSPDSNPWLRGSVDTAMGQAQGALNSQFNKPGAFGSTAHQGVMAKQLGDISNNAYMQNYNQERGNQLNVMSQAPGMAASDYNDMDRLMGSGDAQRAAEQERLSGQYGAWQQAQQYPYQQLDVMGNAIMTTMGAGGKTTMYGNGSSGAGQAVGAGLAGLGLLGG